MGRFRGRAALQSGAPRQDLAHVPQLERSDSALCRAIDLPSGARSMDLADSLDGLATPAPRGGISLDDDVHIFPRTLFG